LKNMLTGALSGQRRQHVCCVAHAGVFV
jgi:hypothetical protein